MGGVSCGEAVIFLVRVIVSIFMSVCVRSATRWPCGSPVVCVTKYGVVGVCVGVS